MLANEQRNRMDNKTFRETKRVRFTAANTINNNYSKKKREKMYAKSSKNL